MKELEEYAMINKIPIMQKDGILYLCNYIKENNIKNIKSNEENKQDNKDELSLFEEAEENLE